MKTLLIKDLPVTEELDRKAMACVVGGTSQGYTSYNGYSSPFGNISKSEFSFDASQLLGQSQNTLVNNGNNVAFSHDITSTVKPEQTGTNNINLGRYYG